MSTAKDHLQAIQRELREEELRAPEPSPAAAVIQLEDVHLAFGEQVVLDGVSLEARKGETLMVAGESGTGKSTILKLIMRLLVPEAGRVSVLGEDVAHLSFEEALDVRRQIGMVFQNAALFDSLTIYDNIAYPLRENTEHDEAEIERTVRERLDFVDLDPDQVMGQLPSQLSGGMRKRVGIARAGTINQLIRKLQRELHVTSILVTHDVRAGFRVANRVNLLRDGKIVFDGSPEHMIAEQDDYIRAFLS
jgi:phospholipid/cholesterol/gamma-HCH transport system ATP-binding protein